MLTSRQIDILKVVIRDFIDQAKPVGSQKLKAMHELPYSTATIRNEMATLEDLGLLQKTHTSSGRVPSNLGYRYFVDYLVDDQNEISDNDKARIESIFENRKLAIDDIVKEATNLIAEMTNYTSIALGSDYHEEVLSRIEVVPLSEESVVIVVITKAGKVQSKIFQIENDVEIEDLQKCVKVMNKMLSGEKMSDIIEKINLDMKDMLKAHMISYEYLLDAIVSAVMNFSKDHVYVSGKSNTINQPDFNDIDKIKSLINFMEGDYFFDYLINSGKNPSVKIGDENDVIEVEDVSVVTSNYQLSDNEKGIIAIIGPTRMDYDKVIALLDYVSSKITHELGEKKR